MLIHWHTNKDLERRQPQWNRTSTPVRSQELTKRRMHRIAATQEHTQYMTTHHVGTGSKMGDEMREDGRGGRAHGKEYHYKARTLN